MIKTIMSYIEKLGGEQSQCLIDAENVNNECFVHIFLRLDSKTLRNCMLACHRFRSLLSNDSFWVERARIIGRVNNLPPFAWRKATNQKKFKGNESGEIDVSKFAFNFPIMVHSGGYSTIRPTFFSYFDAAPNHIIQGIIRSDEFKIGATGNGIQMEQNSGYGCEPHTDVEKCFAFSFANSSIYIFVDLVAKGIDPWILDYVRPKIRISQKINHRHDCAASLTLAAQLNYHETQWVQENGQVQVSRNTDLKRSKSINKQWPQWTEATWADVALEFNNYPSGMRHLTVLNTGKDDQFWQGFYGPKIANIEIKVILPEMPVVRPLQEDTERKREDDEPHNEQAPQFRLPFLRGRRNVMAIPPAIFHNPAEE
uniref:FBA domain-containing protein n=1 Tax=Caenorhabditis japonica TaxID=281687 RepID=A0A8R1DEN9_CAEJA